MSPSSSSSSSSSSSPPPFDDGNSSSSNNVNNDNNDNDYGPVTRLAQLAAAREEEARSAQRLVERATVQATASVVGETALAIAAAAASASRMSSSPRGVGSVKMSTSNLTTTTASPREAPPAAFDDRSSPPSSLSVAARARAAADLPSSSLPSSTSSSSSQWPGGRRDDNDDDEDDNDDVDCNNRAAGGAHCRPDGGGNAGVSRGKFSPQQVKVVLDRWGKDDTDIEDDDYDVDDKNYNDKNHNDDVEDDWGMDIYSPSHDERFKESLGRTRHHLMYTMSESPERRGGAGTTSTATTMATTTNDQDASAMTSARAGRGDSRHRHVPPPPQSRLDDGDFYDDEDENDYDWGLGIFASARSWLRSQRDRLHQLELERQVEDQRRKLVEEGRRQRALAAERRRGCGGGDDHEGEDARDLRRRRRAQLEEEQLIHSPEEAAMPYLMCGFGGTDLSLSDHQGDFLGVTRFDSSGNIMEMIPRDSSHDVYDNDDDDDGIKNARGEYNIKVSSPRWTRTGEGMSVKVDYSDFDNNACVTDDGSSAFFEQEGEGDGKGDGDGEGGVRDVHDDDLIIGVVPEEELFEVSSAPHILQPSHMKSLISSGALPPSLNFCKWKRLYSLARDGDSFEQFLRLVEGHDRTVLNVLTTHGRLFGGYADTRWEAQHTRHNASDFYGSAQACLFRFPNYGADTEGKKPGDDEDNKIIIYKWSGINRYIQLCDSAKRALAFGGGGDDGYFGLCIEDDFRRGTTGRCSTFQNEALCEEGYFECKDLEVWGFILDF
ncbi:hypothetical protein ACHAXA_004760 [Cyclostephanos tholiformis]|uniref:Oxidation resistance protein 1 n=1 Tax=Cyclostephanos tholiformis TaxID=382380 RepID=A0ABD3RF04_9STRA